jgi:hypothetical protein
VESARRISSALWGRHLAAAEYNLPRKVDSRSRASPDVTSMDFFLMGAPEGAYFCSPFQDYRRSRGKISSSCNNCWCQTVVKNMLQH